MILANYYRKVVDSNEDRLRQLRGRLKFDGDEERKFVDTLPGSYQSIEMNKLPKGLELQVEIEVEVERPAS